MVVGVQQCAYPLSTYWGEVFWQSGDQLLCDALVLSRRLRMASARIILNVETLFCGPFVLVAGNVTTAEAVNEPLKHSQS